MRLDRAESLGGDTVAEFACAADHGADQARILIEPLLATLYGFLARRTSEAEEAEDVLVDTLLAARAHAPQMTGDDRPLLGWLLATALHILRSCIGADPVLESGLEHHQAGLPVRLSAGLHQALPRLSRVERLALGMRFADALPIAVIAQAIGRSEHAVHALLGTALARIGRACYPTLAPTWPEPEQLDYYVSALLAGDHAAPPDSLRPETVAIVTALVGLHTSVEVVPGLHERVWHEYGQRREEYLPGRPFPSAPTWLLPIGLILLLALALGAGSYWLLSRQVPQEPRRIAGAAAQPSATFVAVFSGSAAPPTSARPLYTPGPGRQALSELAGKLYYVQPGTVLELFSVNLGARDPSGFSSPERVLRIGPGILDYDISPTDGMVAYSTGRGLWTQDAEGGIRYLAPLTRRAETSPTRRDRPGDVDGMLRARHAVWHPQGHTIAFVDDGHDGRSRGARAGQSVFTYTPGLDTALGEPLFVLDASDEARALSWSADGKYLAVRTRRGSHMVRVDAKGARRSFFLENRDVHWSQHPANRSVLVTERREPGTDAPFGVTELDGSDYRVLGTATFVTWQPNGKGILFVRRGRRAGSGMSLWRHNLASQEPEKVSDVPAMGRGVREVVFSPDGRYLAFTTARGAWVASVSDGEAVELPGVPGLARGLRWRADPARYVPPRTALRESGTILYTRSVDRGMPSERRALMLLDPVNGVENELRTGVRLQYAVSPFHTSALVAADGALEVLDLEAGTFTRLEQPPEDVSIGALAWHPSGLEVAYVESENGGRGSFPPRLVRVDLRTHRRSVMRAPNQARAPESIAYSPSGRHMLLSADGDWYLMDLKGGRTSPLPAASGYVWRPGQETLLRTGRRSAVANLRGRVIARLPSGYSGLRWVNRNTVLASTQTGQLALHDMSKRRTVAASPVQRRYGAPSLSPGGTYVLESTATTLWVRELHTGRREWLASAGSAYEDMTWIPLGLGPDTVRNEPLPVVEPDAGSPALFFTDLETDSRKSQSAFAPLWMSVRGKVPERLADVSAWDTSPGGGEVVYIDRYGLWILNVGTREERLVLPFEDGVTDPDTRLADPEWSPDGTLITFVVVPRDYGYRYFRHLPLGVYLVDPVTAKLHGRALAYSRNPHVMVATEWSAASDTVLAAGVARTVEYHVAGRKTQRTLQFGQTSEPKGSTLAYDPSVLYLANRHGRVGTLMLRRGGRAHELSARAHAHVWSPAGDSVYFFEGGDLWRSSKDGTYRWRVRAALPGGRDARSPLWTRDGRLTYVSGKTVWIVDPATGAVRRLLRWHNPLLEAEWGRSVVSR